MGKANFSIMSRRAALIGAASLAASCASPTGTSAEPTRVLFVCQYGTVKSAIAREQFRRLAATRGILVHVQSRGISPEDHISPALSEALAADGLDIRGEPIRALSTSDLACADIIVAFDSLPVRLGAWSVRDWSDVPSMNANYGAARAVLLERLNVLMAEIERK